MKKDREITDQPLFEKIIGLNVLTSEYYTSVVLEELKPEYIDNPGVRLVTNIVFDFYTDYLLYFGTKINTIYFLCYSLDSKIGKKNSKLYFLEYFPYP